MSINGLPLHPLVVHAAVVFAPLAAVSAGLYALVTRWRWLLRTPTAVIAVLAALATQVAAMTGDSLKETLGIDTSAVENHEMWAGRLQAAVWVLAAVAVVAWWVMPHETPVEGAEDREARVPALVTPVVVLLPVLAVAVLVLVVFTGDAGARAVWG
ncbi:MAG TPA: DUF2231 domain-containing protein [Nocardioides sp.]|jgi:hypothetical protein